MTRLVEKLSPLISGQLPEFIRSDYTTFTAFVEAYYEFLEQDQNAQELLQNSLQYSDIDRTVDSFIDYFIKQYCNNIPKNILANKSLLIKYVNSLYANKGTQTGYKLLFQLLFGKQVEIFQPSELILKPSSATWVQKTSVFVRVIFGNIDDIIDTTVYFTTDATRVPVRTLTKKIVTVKEGTDISQSSEVYEVFFDNKSNPVINIGDIVSTAAFRGQVVGTSANVVITSGGTGFRVGDVLSVNIANGIGTKLKVTSVAAGGVITGLQFLTFGVNYPDNFYIHFTSETLERTLSYFDVVGANVTLKDDAGPVVDYGFINLANYLSGDAWDASYVGEILGVFDYETITITVDDPVADYAVFNITEAAKAKYPGYYQTTEGFLSDEYALQDPDYYQPFTYVLRIDEQLKSYRNAVLDILHPAGTKLNADYRITNNIDLFTQVTTVVGFILNDLFDAFQVVEDSVVILVTKPLTETLSLTEPTPTISITKLLANTFTLIDETLFDISVGTFIDTVVVSDESYYDLTKPLAFNNYALNYFEEGQEQYTADGDADSVSLVDDITVELNP